MTCASGALIWGESTFVGSSGRVFPDSFKASPLLRAWLVKLDRLGVELRNRHRWTGWDEGGALTFDLGGGGTAGLSGFGDGPGVRWRDLAAFGLYRGLEISLSRARYPAFTL